MKRFLLGGIVANWREWRFYRKHRELRSFLQPTYFSIGLLNIQRYGRPISEDDSEAVYHAFFRIGGQDLIRDGHHWINASNFHLAADGPTVLDYGGSKTQEIIKKHGLALKRDFSLEYGRAQQVHFQSKRASP